MFLAVLSCAQLRNRVDRSDLQEWKDRRVFLSMSQGPGAKLSGMTVPYQSADSDKLSNLFRYSALLSYTVELRQRVKRICQYRLKPQMARRRYFCAKNNE